MNVPDVFTKVMFIWLSGYNLDPVVSGQYVICVTLNSSARHRVEVYVFRSFTIL